MSRQTNSKMSARKRKTTQYAERGSEESVSEEIEDSPKLKKMAKSKNFRKKENLQDEEIDGTGLEMDKMLKSMGFGYQKNLATKKKQMQQMAEVSLKTSVQKLDEFLDSQKTARKNLHGSFSKSFENVFSHWENDMKNIKEQFNKIQILIVQQQKSMNKLTAVQDERFKAIRDLIDQFVKASDNIEEQQKEKKDKLHDELNNEVAEFQNKVMAENQKKMDNMKNKFSKLF